MGFKPIQSAREVMSSRILRAMRMAVRQALKEHWKNNNPVYVLRGDKIVRLAPAKTKGRAPKRAKPRKKKKKK